MVMSYILEDDLLAHLPYSDAAVNLTTLMSPWGMGLSKAYAEKFPEVYKRYQDAQEKFELKLAEVWVDRENDKSPDLFCVPMKTLVKDFGDTDNVKKALDDISKASRNHYDVIMPITITGDLKDSLKLMYEHLDKNPDIHFWVGVSEQRAKDQEFTRDKKRVFLHCPDGFEITDEKLLKLGQHLKDKGLSSKDIKFVTYGDRTKDIFPSVERISYPSKKEYLKRIVHYSDMGIAVIDEGSTDIPFNEFIQAMRNEKLDIAFVSV